MTDPDAVLGRIDAVITACICGRTIPTDGPSLDYCSLPCQYRYAAGLPVYEPAHDVWRGATDGRTINAEVNAWFRASSNDHPDLGWASAAVARHDETDTRTASPRLEYFPSPHPGEPLDLAGGVDLTPFITAMEVVTTSAATCAEAMTAATLEVGDAISFTMPDGTTTRSIVTHANEDGSFDCEPASSDTRSST
ncbi:hypothetical protein [Glycomyces sp. NPDC021274]|uniref:hypothetical protein n=1 Tax=Glycomyces sp. NPDC021274 TaxID=3155120 RepID=UPI0033F3DEFD